jgi:hypothetical protein
MTDEQMNARTDARHAAKLRRLAGVLRDLWKVSQPTPWIMSGVQMAALHDAAELLAGFAAEPLHKPDFRVVDLKVELQSLVRTSNLLFQNALGCASMHHGLDLNKELPGWLRDTKASIESAEAALATERGQS